MSRTLSRAHDVEDKLFIAMLELRRKGAGPEFDLHTICSEHNIAAEDADLLSFVSDNEGLYGTSGSTLSSLRFTLSVEGQRHARKLEDKFKPKTVTDRLNSFSRSDWIAFGAFLVSIIALFKGG